MDDDLTEAEIKLGQILADIDEMEAAYHRWNLDRMIAEFLAEMGWDIHEN